MLCDTKRRCVRLPGLTAALAGRNRLPAHSQGQTHRQQGWESAQLPMSNLCVQAPSYLCAHIHVKHMHTHTHMCTTWVHEDGNTKQQNTSLLFHEDKLRGGQMADWLSQQHGSPSPSPRQPLSSSLSCEEDVVTGNRAGKILPTRKEGPFLPSVPSKEDSATESLNASWALQD